MQHNKPFGNPYANLTRSYTKTVTCEIALEDYYAVKNIRPETGTIAAVIGTLWKKLANELRKRDLGDYTNRTEFEHFIANCELVDPTSTERGGLPHGASSGAVPKATPHDD